VVKITGEQWQQIWLWPCIAAGVIALIFFLFFKEKPKTAVEAA
jgi:sugar phosphate permease